MQLVYHAALNEVTKKCARQHARCALLGLKNELHILNIYQVMTKFVCLSVRICYGGHVF